MGYRGPVTQWRRFSEKHASIICSGDLHQLSGRETPVNQRSPKWGREHEKIQRARGRTFGNLYPFSVCEKFGHRLCKAQRVLAARGRANR